MVELRPWIDLTPTRQGAATAAQLTQADRSVMAVVSGTPESDVSVPAGMVEVTIPDSSEPPAVVPADGGITSLGAEVLCKRDSSGRITSASTPTRLPAGAQPVAVGVTGEWLASLDALTSSLDHAQSDLNQAQTQLKEHLATLGIDTDNVTVTDELWARLATFAKVTTDMLTAGNAVITGDLLADVITGIILRGGLFEAGGGSLPMIRVGPLSGTPGSGDAYGVYLTTPNSNANGSASLEVTPAGPSFSMLNGSGTTLLSMDSVDGLKVKDYDSDSVISVSQMILNSYSVTETNDIAGNTVTTSNGAWSPWRDFETLGGATDAAGAIKVMTPTGRFQVTLQAGFTDTAANDFYLGQVNVNFGTSPHGIDQNPGLVASTPLSATFQPKNSEVASTLLSYPFVGTVDVPANTQLYVWFSFRSLHVSVTNGYGHCNYRALTIKPI